MSLPLTRIEVPKVKGYVVVELIDRKTGKVVRSARFNAIFSEFAYMVATAIVYGTSFPKITDIQLFSGTSFIKSLATSNNYSQDTAAKQYVCTFTAQDLSTDTYTFDNLYLVSGTTYTLAHQTLSAAMTKGSDQTLKITWYVYLPYDEAPP